MKKNIILFSFILIITVSKIHAQYDSVFHWKSGVMIHKQSVKLTDLDSITFRRPVAIGQFFQGGVIAYILQAGDPGYVAGVTHGLIAAISDLSSSRWYNGTYTLTGASGTALGNGSNNTNLTIISQGNTGTYAAKLCRNYNGGGYTDWFLPSKDELNKLYLNKIKIGGFSNNYYWSSTEIDTYNAWYQSFLDGDTGNIIKNYINGKVRAVRRF